MKSKISLSSIAIWIIFAAMLATMGSYHNWTRSKPGERGVIKWDVISYYGYLPATFIYGDVKLGFIADKDFANNGKFMYYRLENGNRLIQTSMGLSILYSPFFFTAHALAPLFGQASDGYSSIYQLFLALSSLFYVIIGLFFLKRILLRYFSKGATAISLLLVGLGTNLFFYTVHEGPMSHAYNFALITIFFYLIIRWYERPALKTAIWLGLTYGMIVLVRPSNIIAGVLFLFWGVSGWTSCRERIRFLTAHVSSILVMVFFFILPWIPQFIYWKAITGSFIYNSYGPSGSSFFLDSPHIREILFSYRKGWFVYTPVMLLATMGLAFLKGKLKQGSPGILIYLVLQVYLLSSWWSWWNGGSFGLRSFVDIYGVMALPLAALIEHLLKRGRTVALLAGALLTFLIYVNQYQTFQYTRGVIHYTGMTKEAYWLNFLKLKPSGAFWQMLSIPDSELARLGIYYDYHTGSDNSALKELEEARGMEQVRMEISGDRKLSRQIGKHAHRAELGYDEALEVVVSRVYNYKISH
ncbi:MAG: hypothetical protein ABFS28_07320 [Bacteroidota bacterium]